MIYSLQDYVRELAICMVLGGESLQHDLNNPNGIRLTQLHGELCALCSAKARCNLQAHRQFVSQPLLPTAPDTDASPKPDWLTLAVSVIGCSYCQGKRVKKLERKIVIIC